jgi:hypothetical protein
MNQSWFFLWMRNASVVGRELSQLGKLASFILISCLPARSATGYLAQLVGVDSRKITYVCGPKNWRFPSADTLNSGRLAMDDRL